MSATEQEYKNHIKELEQQVRLLKEQVDFLTRKLYGYQKDITYHTCRLILLFPGQPPQLLQCAQQFLPWLFS